MTSERATISLVRDVMLSMAYPSCLFESSMRIRRSLYDGHLSPDLHVPELQWQPRESLNSRLRRKHNICLAAEQPAPVRYMENGREEWVGSEVGYDH